MSPLWGWVALAFVCGAFVGISEIISRYRDEPLRAILNSYGGAYVFVNGIISVLAFGLVVRYPTQLFAPLADDGLLKATVAGFGAMVVLRSKLFIFRTEEGKEYSIGPSIVIETLLRVLDRKIDRLRASQRQRRVVERMKGVADFNAAATYLEASLLSFQNLTQDEKAEIARIIDQYRRQTEWPDPLRTMAIGFAFLTIAGEENFDQVIQSLKEYLKLPGTQGTTPPGSTPPSPPATGGSR